MTQDEKTELTRNWRAIGDAVRASLEALGEDELDGRRTPEAMTARETAHHIAESNIIACSMIIAALGASGATYDWSWLYPNTEWVERMLYADLDVAPAIEALTAMNGQVANMIEAREDALACEVTLFDKPGGEPYKWTVEKILSHEVEHARGHLAELTEASV